MAAKGWKKNEQGEWVGPKAKRRKARKPRQVHTAMRVSLLIPTHEVGPVLRTLIKNKSIRILEIENTTQQESLFNGASDKN